MTRAPDKQILKVIWTRHADGRWAAHDLKGLVLRRKPGCDVDFFTIDSKMELLTNTPPAHLTDVFSSFGPTDYLLKQSIMPVVAWVPGAPAMRCIGTGFLVSCSGYLITASHVVLDPQENGYGKVGSRNGRTAIVENVMMGVLMPHSPASGRKGARFIPFQEVSYWGEWRESPILHEGERLESLIDIAICKLPELDGGAAYQPLNLSLNPFIRGEEAYAIGYALMQDVPIDYVAGRAQIPEFEWELHVSTGEVMDVFPLNHLNKDVPTPGPCFDFKARIPGKMSGSPIFGAKGAIIRGVVSRSFSGEKHAFGCMIGPAMKLRFRDGNSLEKLMLDGNEGIAVVQGQGL